MAEEDNPAVEVLAGTGPGDLSWKILVEHELDGRIYVSVRRTTGGRTAESGFKGPIDVSDISVNHFIGKSDGTPTFVLVQASPDVIGVSAIGLSGTEYPLQMSGTVEEFGSLFGATPIPDGEEICEIRKISESEAEPQKPTSNVAHSRLMAEVMPEMKRGNLPRAGWLKGDEETGWVKDDE